MFMASKFPTRLIVRCPVCRCAARVDRADYSRVQMFCSQDGVPLTVMAVMAGCITDDELIDCGPVLTVVTAPHGQSVPMSVPPPAADAGALIFS